MNNDYQHEQNDYLKPIVINAKPLPRRVMLDDTGIMETYLEGRGLDPAIAESNGWYVSRMAGDWETRIVIPATSEMKGHNFWQARAVDPKIEKRYQSPYGQRLDALVIVYPVAEYEHGKGDNPTTIVICEGPLDALAAAGEGVIGLGLMGATPSALCFDHLARRCQGLKVIVVADRDALDKAVNWTTELMARGVYTIKTVYPPEPWKDLAECPKEQRSLLCNGRK